MFSGEFDDLQVQIVNQMEISLDFLCEAVVVVLRADKVAVFEEIIVVEVFEALFEKGNFFLGLFKNRLGREVEFLGVGVDAVDVLHETVRELHKNDVVEGDVVFEGRNQIKAEVS